MRNKRKYIRTTGIILLFSACGGFLVYLSKKQLIKRQESHKEAKEEK